MSAKRTLVVCPGRGSYTKGDLGSLRRWEDVPGVKPRLQDMIAEADAFRTSVGSKTISELDAADRFSASHHMLGENAGPLIYTLSAIDAALLPTSLFRPVAVCGNSMGWYTSLQVGGSLEFADALALVDTMSKTARGGTLGGQVIYPQVDDDWRPDPSRRADIDGVLAQMRATGHAPYVSIELGGFVVLAGDDVAVKGLLEALPPVKLGSREYPFQLVHHSAFHTPLMTEHSRLGRSQLESLPWRRPMTSLVDGCGGIHRPLSGDVDAMVDYTFVRQVLGTYDFTASIRVALREFAPDVIVLLGPGDTLGGAIGQTLCLEGWQGIRSKEEFVARQETDAPILVSLGRQEQFERFIAGA